MNDLLKRNITIKTASVLFAVFLWFFVSYSLNPLISTTIEVPLRVINESTLSDKGIVILNRNFSRTVSVTVRGKKDKINGLSFNDFDATVDLSKVKSADTKQVSVDVVLSKADVFIEEIKQRDINIQLDKTGKNPFNVEIATIGKPKDGYKIIKISAVPQSFALTGLESVIKSVASVKAFVDVSNLDRDVTVRRDCKVYNKDGKEIPELSKDLSADIKIEVAKEVAVIGSIKGKPAKNFADAGLTVNPGKVLISGTPEVLASINQLTVDAVDIENSNQPVKVTRVINLPNGVKLVDSTKEVQVSADVQQLITKDIIINKDDINIINTEIDNSLKYEVQVPSITISLKGINSDLQQIDIGKLKPDIDVNKLTEGIHKVPLNVTLNGTVKLVQDYMVDVKIDKR